MNGSKIIFAAIAAVSALCATGLTVAASAQERVAYNAALQGAVYENRMSDRLAIRMLSAHNRERQRLGLPKLKWNRALEREARDWGRVLARKGRLQHADQRVRNGTGENLWMGTRGQWDILVGIDLMLDERRHYRHDNFPRISRTGKWKDVAHYSQIVWRDTQEVGCSVVNDHGWDVLVCRYWPAGNVWGEKAY